MKKITGLLLAAVLCMPAYAAQTKNTMKMVSYFPVPYVAYDTVSANNAMDIGVLTQCEMAIKKGTSNLGGSACSLYLYGDPNAADLNSGLLNVTAGKLDLNSNVANARIVSKKVQIGKDMTTVGGWLDIGIPSGKAKDYDALYISSLKNTGSSFRVTSKETGAKVNSFHMFNEISNDFPGCAGTVTWKELELAADVDTNKTYTDVYLVCDGTGEVPPVEDCQAPNGLSYTESCPEGQIGSITYTWNQSDCNYDITDTCTKQAICSEGEVAGSQSCNICGVQTTKKCINGEWQPFLGECSKSKEECCTTSFVSTDLTSWSLCCDWEDRSNNKCFFYKWNGKMVTYYGGACPGPEGTWKIDSSNSDSSKWIYTPCGEARYEDLNASDYCYRYQKTGEGCTIRYGSAVAIALYERERVEADTNNFW